MALISLIAVINAYNRIDVVNRQPARPVRVRPGRPSRDGRYPCVTKPCQDSVRFGRRQPGRTKWQV